jgi:Ni/Co efflux regulator RcnB
MKKIITSVIVVSAFCMTPLALAQSAAFAQMQVLNAQHDQLSHEEDSLRNNETIYNNLVNAAQQAQNNGDMTGAQGYVAQANQYAMTINTQIDHIHRLEQQLQSGAQAVSQASLNH